MEAYLSQWQLWLALAVIIGGVKLLDVSLGKYRDWHECWVDARLALQRQVNEVSKGVYGCSHPYIAHDFQPILKRLIALEEQVNLATENGKKYHAENRVVIDRFTQTQADLLVDFSIGLDDLTARVKELEQPQKCCAEKPAKAPPPNPPAPRKATPTLRDTRRSAR